MPGSIAAMIMVSLAATDSLEAQEIRNVTNSPSEETAMAWGLDGSLLVSSDRGGGSVDIYRVSLDGRWDPDPVVSTDEDDFVGHVGSDGRITFVTVMDEDADIHIVGGQPGQATRAVHPTDTDDWFPSFSPDGILYFNTYRYGRSSELVRLDEEADTLIRLTDDDHYDANPQVSPDGRWLLYHSRRGENYDLYVRPVDGAPADERRLTTHEADDSYATWAPDSRRVAFRSSRDGQNELYVLDLETGDQQRLTNTDASENYAEWSPDGRWIAFVTDRDGNGEIYVIEAP